MMSRVLQRLNVLAIWLLGGVLASVLVARIWPTGRPLAQASAPDNKWAWPLTLQVYPAHPGDPVMLVRITKDGKEVVPGRYRMPQIVGDGFQDVDAVKEWLRDASFALKNQSSKNVVSVGIAVVFPARRADIECHSITGSKSAREPWCDAHPHWCDGGCPELVDSTVHWGRIPALTASGLEARYRAEAKGMFGDRAPLQGNEWLRLAPGQEAILSLAGRVEGVWASTDPRHPFSNNMNGILYQEGLEVARDTEPCDVRANTKTGCAFAEVSKFNIGVDVVYFEDGTIWGNYGYGYALPNPDGIFTRVDAHDFPGIATPASAPTN